MLAATVRADPGSVGAQAAYAAALIATTGILFILAGAARMGGMSDFISKPVLRGFTFGLALTIAIKQLPKILGVPSRYGDTLRMALDLAGKAANWNMPSVVLGAAALTILFVLGRRARMPATLVVIVLDIAAGYWTERHGYGIAVVGTVDLQNVNFGLPPLDRSQWLETAELAFALMLILYAESYGSIRSFALKHGDAVSANRDLIALGCANLVAGLLHGMPVGAGYSATSANEAAGAQSRLAGLCAAMVIALIVLLLRPLLAHTPEPVLAAIVIFAVSHSLHPEAFKPYWTWRRDRLVAIAALLAVLVLGVLHGLLVAIGVSLLLTLRRLSEPAVSVLGRLKQTRDFVDVSAHADAKPIPGITIVRPEVPLFFANAERVLGKVRAMLREQPTPVHTVMLSLEETPDVDSSAIEALCIFAAELKSRGQRLLLVRLKPRALAVLERAASESLPCDALRELSVDECVQSVVGEAATD